MRTEEHCQTAPRRTVSPPISIILNFPNFSNINFAGVEDIVDETLSYFRANVLFRNFDVRGGADRTLIYLTLYAVQCLVMCEKIEDKITAVREMRIHATKQFACPGDAGWPLGGLFPASKNKTESGTS